MKITRHHLTDELYRELLNRPSPSIESPSVVLQMALVPNEPASSSIDSFREALDRVCQDHQVQGPGPLNHHHVDFGKVSLRWEQHTEFSSVVLLAADQSTLDDFSLDWLYATEHTLLTGARIEVFSDAHCQEDWVDDLDGVVGGMVLSGMAEIATNLRPNDEGWVPYRIRNIGLDATRMGRLVQRLYEIETYRMMALMGLPLAKQTTQVLNGLERQLVGLVEQLGSTADLTEDQALLDDLFSLAQASEQQMADTDYRFSATQAYGRIVQDRLDELGETATDRHQGLREFLERRFEPALRTTLNITRRQESLSARIARTVSLARTRVEVSLQTQHRTQLEAMARRARLQLRLQRTVEGLSVMAISYYTIGIFAYLFGGWVPTESLKWLISIVSPVLLFGIWWFLKRWRRKLLEDAVDED